MDKTEKMIREYCDEQPNCEECPLAQHPCYDSTGALNVRYDEPFEEISRMVEIYNNYILRRTDERMEI